MVNPSHYIFNLTQGVDLLSGQLEAKSGTMGESEYRGTLPKISFFM